MNPTSSTKKLLLSEGRDPESVGGISDDGVDAVFRPKKRSAFRSVFKAALIHLALLTVYTSIIFSFWPKNVLQICRPRTEALYSKWRSHIMHPIFPSTLLTRQALRSQQLHGRQENLKAHSRPRTHTKANLEESSIELGINCWSHRLSESQKRIWIRSTKHRSHC